MEEEASYSLGPTVTTRALLDPTEEAARPRTDPPME